MTALSKRVIEIKRVADGMVLVTCLDFGEMYQDQLWARARARKSSSCILSERSIEPGEDAYRPVGNSANRSCRMLAAEVDKLQLPPARMPGFRPS